MKPCLNEPISRKAFAALLMLGAALAACAMDASAKLLTHSLPVSEVVFLRYAVALTLVAPWVVLRFDRQRFGPLRWQWARAGFLVADTFLYFKALAQAPFADVVALFNVAPLVVALTSALVLKERVAPPVLVAALLGFVGVVWIVRPDLRIGVGHAYALAAGAPYGLYLIGTRRLASAAADAVLTQAFTLAVGTVAAAIATFPAASFPRDGQDWAVLLVMGACGLAAHMLLTVALKHAPAAVLAPLTYVEVLLAPVVGLFGFGEAPSVGVLLGMGLIVAGGIMTMRR
jgi:drug/metabolite transporter (DMT)-like permease